MKRFLKTALPVALAASGFAAGVGVTGQAPPAFRQDEPANRGLDANLYMQTAAEYRACCLQAFNLAAERVTQYLPAAKAAGKPPAVVLDLDETVFDNAGFQATQLRSGLSYDQRLWDLWEEKSADRVGLIPGAKEFVAGIVKQGVTPVYISNRNDRSREQTKAALARLGLPLAANDHLLLAKETTDKTARRAAAEQSFAVLLYVGDSLRDFDEAYRFADLSRATPEALDAAIKARKEQVDAERAKWGGRWIVLPNPAYGEWAKPLGRGRADYDRLLPEARR